MTITKPRLRSRPEHLGRVAVEQLRIGLVDERARHGDGAAGDALVLAAVMEVVGEVVADAKTVVGRDGDVAGVVETVDIGAQQQAVGERVLAAVRVGAHVRGLERGQRVLAGDGAGAVGAGDGDAEGAPAEPRLHGLRRAVTAELVSERFGLLPEPRRALQALGDDALAVAVQDIDGLAALDARLPLGVAVSYTHLTLPTIYSV